MAAIAVAVAGPRRSGGCADAPAEKLAAVFGVERRVERGIVSGPLYVCEHDGKRLFRTVFDSERYRAYTNTLRRLYGPEYPRDLITFRPTMRKRPPLRAWAVFPDVDGGSRDRVSATELTLWADFRRVASLVDSRT